MRVKNAAGFRAPEPGSTDDTKPNGGTTRPADASDGDGDQDLTGRFNLAMDALEETYDTCRKQAMDSVERTLNRTAVPKRIASSKR